MILLNISKYKANISVFEKFKIPMIQQKVQCTLAKISRKKTTPNNELENFDKNEIVQVPIKKCPSNNSPTQTRKASFTPFPLTFKIYKKTIHNCMINSIASSNVIPIYVCKKLNVNMNPLEVKIT